MISDNNSYPLQEIKIGNIRNSADLSPSKTILTGQEFFKIPFRVSENCPECTAVKTFIEEHLLNLSTEA